jgi:hypothetical protein
MIGKEQAMAGGGTRILREALGDPDLDEPDAPMEVVSVKAALNYIAFGRYGGRDAQDMFYAYAPNRIERRQVAEHGALAAALRVLSRSVRTGKVRVFEVEEKECWEGEAQEPTGPSIVYLWEHPASFFVDRAFITPGIDPIVYTVGLEGGGISGNIVFAIGDIAELADPADADNEDQLDAPPIAEPTRSAGGRKAGTNGAPITRFALRLQALGEAAAGAETHETLGAWLREEYVRLGLKEPNPDNAKRDAVGARRELWGETA